MIARCNSPYMSSKFCQHEHFTNAKRCQRLIAYFTFHHKLAFFLLFMCVWACVCMCVVLRFFLSCSRAIASSFSHFLRLSVYIIDLILLVYGLEKRFWSICSRARNNPTGTLAAVAATAATKQTNKRIFRQLQISFWLFAMTYSDFYYDYYCR